VRPDGAALAHLGYQTCVFPSRSLTLPTATDAVRLDFSAGSMLEFEPRPGALWLLRRTAGRRERRNVPLAFNAANEVAVAAFLDTRWVSDIAPLSKTRSPG
jgi:1-deoxy-D-xylulose 5-phosphate reductoisomerase